MENVEFFIVNRELWLRRSDGTPHVLSERDADIIEPLFGCIARFYREAFDSLSALYAKSRLNRLFFRFRLVSRFCRCNFGVIDSVPDIDSIGRFHFEDVPCPLKGECGLEGVVCHPRFAMEIRPSEKRVLRLLHEGLSKEQIADVLCLSLHTVNNHVYNAFSRLGIHSAAEFVRFADAHQIFGHEI